MGSNPTGATINPNKKGLDVDQVSKLDEIYQAYTSDPRFAKLRKQNINFVPGKGPVNPKVMLVGEYPGPRENQKREPFVGKAGRLLGTLMEGTGLALEDVFKTNLIKYWPEDVYNAGKTRTVTEEEKKASLEYLLQEIDILNPDIVGLCGRLITQAILPDVEKIWDVNGDLMKGRFVPLYHPAFVSYRPEKWNLLKEGYTKLASHVR